jgi:prolipoprotein diacylglyceryltransferase
VLWAIPWASSAPASTTWLTHWEDYFGPGRNPWSALFIWEGGIAIFGSLIGGAHSARWIACRKHRCPADRPSPTRSRPG